MTATSTKQILFVCTGNTCRSPLAAALAVSQCLSNPELCQGWQIESAGLFAGNGAPATPEAVHAAAELGATLEGHISQPLSVEMIRDATVIFCLTQDHQRAVLSLVPEAQHKVHLLDPQGSDVSDPLGGTQELYDETAQALERMVRARLEGLPS